MSDHASMTKQTDKIPALSPAEKKRFDALSSTVKELRKRRPSLNPDNMLICALTAVWELQCETIKALERRIHQLEAQPTVKYLGVYQQDKAYGVGNMVTAQGGIWHANRATTQRPGSSPDWTLAVKRSADGKDARL